MFQPFDKNPSRIASEMAFMHWLYTYTDYEHVLEDFVQQLRECNDGRFYSGIHEEARNISKRKFAPPAVWPWLAPL